MLYFLKGTTPLVILVDLSCLDIYYLENLFSYSEIEIEIHLGTNYYARYGLEFTSCKPVTKAFQIWVSFVLKGQQNHSYRQLDCLYVMDFTSWI